jgi:hypothetical protein
MRLRRPPLDHRNLLLRQSVQLVHNLVDEPVGALDTPHERRQPGVVALVKAHQVTHSLHPAHYLTGAPDSAYRLLIRNLLFSAITIAPDARSWEYCCTAGVYVCQEFHAAARSNTASPATI